MLLVPHVVYLVRHGETASNAVGRYAGRNPEGLLPSGQLQIAKLAARLRGLGIGAIWTSGIRRAAETALIIANALDIPVRVEHKLDEMRMGPWEGLTEREVADRFPEGHRQWLERADELRLPGRETLAELAQRVRPVLHAAASDSAPTILVTHVAPIRVAALVTLGLPLRLYKALSVPNAECFLVEQGHREVRRLDTSTSIRTELSAALASLSGKEAVDSGQ